MSPQSIGTTFPLLAPLIPHKTEEYVGLKQSGNKFLCHFATLNELSM